MIRKFKCKDMKLAIEKVGMPQNWFQPAQFLNCAKIGFRLKKTDLFYGQICTKMIYFTKLGFRFCILKTIFFHKNAIFLKSKCDLCAIIVCAISYFISSSFDNASVRRTCLIIRIWDLWFISKIGIQIEKLRFFNDTVKNRLFKGLLDKWTIRQLKNTKF